MILTDIKETQFKAQLYLKLIGQIRQQEIRIYNKNHQNYLKRINQFQQPLKNIKSQQLLITQNNQRNKIYSYNIQSQTKDETKQENKSPRRKRNRQFANQNIQTPNQNNSQLQYTEYQKKQPIQQHFKKQSEIYEIPQRKISMQLNDKTKQLPQQQEQIQLYQCSQGCGRKFALKQLQKHAKNCKKVFQQKRKPFQTKKAPPQAEAAKRQSSPKQQKKNPDKKPKWKKQSQKWRRMLNSDLPQEQEEDDRIQCPKCGRKFNQTAAQRHIKVCSNKQKRK